MSEPFDTCEKRASYLRTKRNPILPFWQEMAEQFLPMRAQFTRQFYMSEQFADINLTSYPLIVARELKNTFSAMLRPRDQDWFEMTVEREERLDRRGRAWLEWATKVQRRAMYDSKSQFTRATKEGDGDFAVFGNAVLTRQTDLAGVRMLYNCWHLKDTVWAEGIDGSVGEIYRDWNPTATELARRWPAKVKGTQIESALTNEPYRQVKCQHVVIPGEDYDRIGTDGKKSKSRCPWVSLFLDCENKTVLEEVGQYSRIYTLPRWETVSGSQFAYSPAAVAGLPDARLLQAMTLTMMEAGENFVRPPLVATQEAVRSDLAIYSGGVTWVDAEYDERLGEALRPLIQSQGVPVGMELMKDAREKLAEAFYLNKLTLPAPDRDMTAYETGQRIQEWIRSALPLFEPVETEYNAALCEDTFEALMRVGAFGSPRDIPPSVRGQNVRFRFESPLHQATERKKGQLLLEAAQLIGAALQLDPDVASQIDPVAAIRDVLTGIGVPQTWMRDPEVASALAQQRAEQAAQVARTEQIANAGAAAKSLGDAVSSFQQAA